MARFKLPCPSRACDYETLELEYAHAKDNLDIHVRINLAAAAAGDSHKKPETFPRFKINRLHEFLQQVQRQNKESVIC